MSVAAIATSGANSTEMASRVAWLVAAGLIVALMLEMWRLEPRQWFRLDLAALAAAYYLTLAEFLVPQPQFAKEASPESTALALRLVLTGLAGLAVGRHLAWPRRRLEETTWPNPRPAEWIGLLVACFALANLYLFASVQFNPVTLIRELLGPRFSQPWSRERLGDARALLSELQLLNYLIPPMTAWLLARGGGSPIWRKALLSLPLAFLLLISFCSGTRYVLATHAATFATALAWSLPHLSPRRAALLFGVPLLLLLFVTIAALQFRHEGLSQTLSGQAAARKVPAPPKRFIVDNNLRTLAKLTETFPGKHPFLGLEIPWHMIVRPIPRALYPAKPEKLSLSMEEVIGIPKTTIAASFVGEGYLMAGWAGSLLFGLGLGALCALWNRIPTGPSGSFANLLYASGMAWSFLGLRSPIWISVGFLPCIALCLAVTVAFPVARRLLPAQGAEDHGSCGL